MFIDILQVVEIAKLAGQKIMEIYENEALDWQVDRKADNSPLTIADKASHEIICANLTEKYPEIPILSEESDQDSYRERMSWEKFWMVDPLDGTKEFIKKNGEFTVNIALIEKGKVTLGVVYIPASDDMYHAKLGEGAYHHITKENEIRLKTNKVEKDQKGVKVVCSRSHMSEETKRFVSQYDNPEFMSAGSSLKFLLIASGRADVYPRMAPTMEWDTAAAQIIVEDSGGKVLDAISSTPLVYNKENLLNPHFVVYS